MNYSRIYEGAEQDTKLEFKTLSHESVRLLIRETVAETLVGLGFETSNPTQTQADMLYLRKLRHGSDEARRIVSRAVLTLIATGLLYMLWEGLKGKL